MIKIGDDPVNTLRTNNKERLIVAFHVLLSLSVCLLGLLLVFSLLGWRRWPGYLLMAGGTVSFVMHIAISRLERKCKIK